jgi:hypothetical protein
MTESDTDVASLKAFISMFSNPPLSLFRKGGKHGLNMDQIMKEEKIPSFIKRDSGEIRFRSNYYFLSELLAGEQVGLTELYDGRYEVRFSFHPICIIDLKEMKVCPAQKKVLPMSIG